MDIKNSQNFLINKNLIQKILSKCNFDQNSIVYDIGAGKGFLTDLLLEKNCKVIAFEKDEKLKSILDKKYHREDRVEVRSDFLEFQIPKNRPQQIFSNLPFNQTTLITKRILIDEPFFDEIYLIIQKEAGERLLGIFEGLMLSLLILPKFEIKIIKKLSRYDFNPRPKVDSVIMYFKKRSQSLIPEFSWERYCDFLSFIVMQQKPNILDRVIQLFISKNMALEFLKRHEIDPRANLYEIPKLSYIESFLDFEQNYKNLHHKTLGSYQKYIETGAKNQKVFRATNKR